MSIEIETPHLMLRPLRPTDIDPLVLGLNDLEIAKWLAFVPHPYTKAHAEAWITQC